MKWVDRRGMNPTATGLARLLVKNVTILDNIYSRSHLLEHYIFTLTYVFHRCLSNAPTYL